MARHGGQTQSGIESLTPRVGMLTAISLLVAGGAAVWIFCKQPKVFVRAVVASAVIIACFLGDGNIVQHWLLGLGAICVGASLVGEHK